MCMKKNKIKVMLFSFIGLLILAILIIPKLSFTDQDKNVRSEFKEAVSVKGKVLKKEMLGNSFTAAATLLGNESVMLRSETSGKIINLNINEGNFIKKGELLVKINDSELQARKVQAESRLKLLEDQEYRIRNLFEKEGVSQEEYDVIKNELNIQKSEIEYLKAMIDKTEIRAPFNGYVGLKNVSEGAYITPDVEIASFVQSNKIKIDFSVPQRYLNSLKKGSEIEFSLPYIDEIKKAVIYAVEPTIDMQTRTLKIRAIVDNSDNRLLPGSYAEVKILIDKNENALMVPTGALVPELGGEKVYIVKNGKAEERKVSIGVRTADDVEITGGVNEGDTVIVSGIIQLKPGIDVKITELSNNQ